MKGEKYTSTNLLKEGRKPLLFLIPIIFMFMLQYRQTNLFIPQLGIKLNSVQFLLINQVLIISWMGISPFEKVCNSYFLHFARNLLPVEMTMLLFSAQYHFRLAAVVLGMTIAALIFWAIAIKKAFPEKQPSVRYKMFKRIGIQTVSIFLSVTLVIGLYSMLSDRPLVNSSIRAGSMEYSEDSDGLNADILRSLAIFGDDRWDELPLEDKTGTLQYLLNLEAAYLKIEPLTLKVVKLEEYTLGSCYYERGTVYIDFEHMRIGGPFDCIVTICHEAYHAYQNTVVDILDFTDDFVKASPYFENARNWRDNFENYIFAGMEYFLQPVEADAFSYSHARGEFYFEQILGR